MLLCKNSMKLTKLHSVFVAATEITDEGLNKLKEALPGLSCDR